MPVDHSVARDQAVAWRRRGSRSDPRGEGPIGAIPACRFAGHSRSFASPLLWFVATCILVALTPGAFAHDPDTTGGLYRTLDAGATWSPVNPGIFPSGALALALSPREPDHLLLATDSGVWRSKNGGRDWEIEAPDILRGPAFAAVFDLAGQRALVAAGDRLLHNDGAGWRAVRAPAEAMPARAMVAGAVVGRVYLVGRSGLYRSDDFGRSWSDIGKALKAARIDALLVAPGRPDEVYAVAADALWASSDGARNWQRSAGRGEHRLEAVSLDPAEASRLWAIGEGRVSRSDNRGERWQPVGKPLPEPAAKARGLAVSGKVIVIATDRGLFRSADGGERWDAQDPRLPAHLAAGVLVGDPRSAATLYAGFALAGYEELSVRVQQSETAFARFGWERLAGITAFILLVLGVYALLRYRALLPKRALDGDGTRVAHRAIDPVPR